VCECECEASHAQMHQALMGWRASMTVQRQAHARNTIARHWRVHACLGRKGGMRASGALAVARVGARGCVVSGNTAVGGSPQAIQPDAPIKRGQGGLLGQAICSVAGIQWAPSHGEGRRPRH